MKKFLTMLVLLAVVPATMAVPIAFTETWDSYAPGADDPAYKLTWSTVSGMSRYPVASSANDAGTPQSAPNNLDQPAGGPLGIINVLNDGVEMGAGEFLAPTAASPIVAGIYWNPTSNNRRENSMTFELLQGDTVVAGVANCAVVALGDNNNAHWYRGSWFRDRNLGANIGTEWNHFWMEITPGAGAGFTVTYHLEGNLGSGESTFTFDTGTTGVDAIRISSVDGTTASSWIDDVYITGGEIVPEPTTIALFGVGFLFLHRRRS